VLTPSDRRSRAASTAVLALLAFGCGGGPSDREVANARAFEALLTAVSLRDPKELEADARLIEARHDSGELSDGGHQALGEVIAKARAKDWAGAERRAYQFRAKFGDSGAYFR
jgi:hypothetical protein